MNAHDARHLLALMKSNRYRWNPKARLWYAKNTPEALAVAQQIATAQ